MIMCVCVLNVLCENSELPVLSLVFVEEHCVSSLVGLCGGINNLVRQAWLSPREAQSSMFILHLRRLLADEDVHMQD